MKRRMSWLLVALAALLAFPAAASAAPFNVTFDEARLQLNNGVVDEDEPTTNTTFNGTIDDTTGDITVPQNQVAIARFTTSTGAPVIANPNEAYTGNYDAATGDLTIGGNTNVVVPTSATGGCVFPGVEIEFSTDGAAPSGDFEGTPFTDGLTGDIGSAVTSFTDLPAVQTYGDGNPATCNTLASLADGPGALQIGNDISLVPFQVDWAANRLQLNNGVVDEDSTTNTTMNGTLDLDDNSVNVPANQVGLARFTSSTTGAPIVSTATEAYTGSYDSDSGDLSIGGSTDVRVITDPQGQGGCIYSGVDLAFDTANEAPSGDFVGAPFEDGLDGATGSALAEIADLPDVATFGNGNPQTCATLNQLADGPGAVAIGNEIVEPVVPPDPVVLGVTSRPANAKVKQGQAKQFRVNVTQEGAVAATTARVCARVPGGRKGLKLVGPRCKSAGDVYDEAGNVTFNVKSTNKTAPKRYTLRFTATAEGAESASDTSKLQVQKKKKRRGRN